jgi:hypothetical protein
MKLDDVKERFDEKWEQNEDGCWIWQSTHDSGGYGQFWLNGRNRGAHRVAYFLYVESLSGNGLDSPQVNHECHVRDCVNPDHLYLGTQSENIKDAIEAGTFAMDGQRDEGHGQVKLSLDDVDEIVSRYNAEDISQSALATEYEITQSHVSRLVNGERRITE